MKFPQVKFSELYSEPSRNGVTKPSRIRGSGYKMINMGELFQFDRIGDIPMERVPLDEREKAKFQVSPGDLLFARQSLVLEGAGKCSIVKNANELTVFESHLIRVRLDQNKADPNFYFYYFKSPQSPVKTIVSQCAQAGIRSSDLGGILVSLPEIEQQRKIAEILSVYDDLIENNRRQIKLLEEAAQLLYKEWFVNLKFPEHENVQIVDGLPKGWKKGTAQDFFKISIGKTPPRKESQWFNSSESSLPWASISDMGDSGIYLFNTKESITDAAIDRFNIQVVPEDTVVVSFKLTVGRVAITSSPMATNEAIAHFQATSLSQVPYIYEYLRNFQYDTLGNTSSISKAVNSKIIKSMPFVMPDGEVMEKFYALAKDIFKLIKSKTKENKLLIESRDLLLPKLMSGEIEV